jgi:hypothetical protein
MSLSIGNRLNGIIPRGALAQVRSPSDTSGNFELAEPSFASQPQLQHGRARDLAGTMPAASWQVLADAAEHPSPVESAQINGSYGFVSHASHKYAHPKDVVAA